MCHCHGTSRLLVLPPTTPDTTVTLPYTRGIGTCKRARISKCAYTKPPGEGRKIPYVRAQKSRERANFIHKSFKSAAKTLLPGACGADQ